MQKTLLASASMVALLTSVSVMAADYTGIVTTTPNESFYIEKGSSLKDATFDLKAEGTDQTANRVSIGGYDENSTITVQGNNVIKDFLTVEPGQDGAKTTLAGNGNLAVEGYLTSTRNADADFGEVNLTLKKGADNGSVAANKGALVLDNDTTAFKVGNVNFTDGTNISLYKAQAGENGELASGEASNMQIAAGKTVTFEGNNKIAASGSPYNKTQFNIKGEKDSKIVTNGKVNVDINTSIDGSNLNIVNTTEAPAQMVLKDDTITLDIKNSQVSMTGAPNGVMNGINSTDGMSGTVNLGENTNVNMTKGAGIAVGNVNIGEGSVVNASGYMDVANPSNPKWRSGSMIQGDKTVIVAEGGTVNLSDGGQMVVGYNTSDNTNHMDINGTVNMSGTDALIRASSSQDGTNTSTLNIGGVVNILKDAVSIIASRVTDVMEGGAVNVASGSTLNLVQDMNRAVDGSDTGAPTGDNAKFDVSGTLSNSGIINAEKTDITIKGLTVANQPEGGKYVSSNGTLNGNLKLVGANNNNATSDEQFAAAPKADFYGDNKINGVVDNSLGLITINKGAALTVVNGEEANKLTNNGIVQLYGTLNANVDGAGAIDVKDSAAHVTSFSDNSLDIGADIASSSLVSEESTASQIYVSKGANFTIDNSKIATNDLVISGTTNLGVDYASAKNKINDGGTLNLASNKLTGNMELWGGSTLGFNVDKTASGDIDQVGGQIEGDMSTNFNEGETATINPVIALGAGDGIYKYVSGTTTAGVGPDAEFKLSQNNAIYNVGFTEGDKGSLDITKKNSSEVASSITAAGGSANNANTVNAWVGGNSDAAALTGASQAMAEHLNTLAQTNPEMLVEATTALAPETNATVQSTATENANQIFGAVGTRLSGGSVSTGGEGMSSGDSIMNRGAMWVQGLFNKSKLDDTHKSKGFDADSQGIAFGAEKYINNDVKAGVGYAYNTTDIDGFMRKTDVDTHTAIAYGEYKPSNWYVNGIATYGWSDYSEKKNVAGMQVKADYDVGSVGLQAMTGYDMNVSGVEVTPEAGLRYVNIRQDSYRDSSGQKVGGNTSDILTGVIGAKVKKDFMMENGMNLRPEARVAMTYDMVNDSASSVVSLANGSAYTVDGQALDRMGWEVGAGLTTDVNEMVEVSVGYEGKFRDHYEDHTGLLNAKYKF